MSYSFQVCPSCYSDLHGDEMACPHCGAVLAQLSARGYAEKLIAALDHPLAEVRMRAIVALGLRQEAAAVQSLGELALRHPIDVLEGLAVVDCLAQIRTGASWQMIVRLEELHPAHAVRVAARAILRRLRS